MLPQGGALALHCALRWARPRPPAGVLCMSGYLPLPSEAKRRLMSGGGGGGGGGGHTAPHHALGADTPILMLHGDADVVVRPQWARE
jgi:predicted esterase